MPTMKRTVSSRRRLKKVMAFQTWPHKRNVSKPYVMLDLRYADLSPVPSKATERSRSVETTVMS
jgi:hypothetical protein